MPVKDLTKTPFVNDNNDNVSIGIDMPFHKGFNGWFATTSTTIDSVKVNIVNLLKTNTGERLMQPNLGLKIREYLFEVIDVDMVINVQNSILDSFSKWLPFVEVRDISVVQDDTNKNQFRISIDFNIKQDPNTVESVSLDITNE